MGLGQCWNGGADSEIGCEEARSSWPWDDLLGLHYAQDLSVATYFYVRLLGKWALSWPSRSYSHIPNADIQELRLVRG